MSYPPYNDPAKPALQGQGYVPPQADYPPQQGYPSQQPGHPPQEYPQQQPPYPAQGYPPQGYPPQEHIISNATDGPPAYTEINPSAPPPVVQQQAPTNVVIAQQQPTSAVYTTSRPVSNNFLVLSIVLTICCFLCGTWYGLLCTIPALIFAIMARDAQKRGDNATAINNAQISFMFNFVGIGCWMVITFSLVTIIIVTVGFESVRRSRNF